MNNLMLNIVRILSYFFKKNRKFIFLTDDITPRLNKMCKALDDIGFSYELIILKNLSPYNNLGLKKKIF